MKKTSERASFAAPPSPPALFRYTKVKRRPGKYNHVHEAEGRKVISIERGQTQLQREGIFTAYLCYKLTVNIEKRSRLSNRSLPIHNDIS